MIRPFICLTSTPSVWMCSDSPNSLLAAESCAVTRTAQTHATHVSAWHRRPRHSLTGLVPSPPPGKFPAT